MTLIILTNLSKFVVLDFNKEEFMVKVYVMESCPDCIQVKQQYKDNSEYELIDIGKQAKNLKEFLALRDNHHAFERVRERGNIGIPCFVMEDGSVIISLKRYEDLSVQKEEAQLFQSGAACNLDGSGC